MSSNLIHLWLIASRDLHLEIEPRFVLSFQSGAEVKSELLLRDFGAHKGMLIITDYSQGSHLLDEINAAGCGFSTLREPSHAKYDRSGFINMLNDWGWSGPVERRPKWCVN